MGMYTELAIGVELKGDTPKQVIDTLAYMVNNESPKPDPLPDHPFFKTDRWGWCLLSGGSYYFDAKPCRVWEYDDISNAWYLTVWTNIKNYSEEWENFLDWLAPWMETKGFIGHYRYEEDEDPTLLYNLDGRVKWIRLNSVPTSEDS